MGLRGVVFVALVLCLFVKLDAQLQVGFYANTCPKAEFIVRDVVKSALRSNVGFAADFLRMHFHDCFVRGCDASILLDSTSGNTAEKDSPINNPSLKGFDVIDTAKSQLEAACKGVVSCADIIAFAARDGTNLAGGPFYNVPSGRKDGRVSKASDTFSNIPAPTLNLDKLTSLFASKGLNQHDMIALSGAHTIGKSHCSSFDNRLYNFSTQATQDPTLNPTYAKKLEKRCPKGSTDASLTAPLDPITPDTFDSNYYRNILSRRVLFTSDQTLISTRKAAAQVRLYAHNSFFFGDFAAAMVKMGKTDVLTGADGEVRLNCRVVN